MATMVTRRRLNATSYEQYRPAQHKLHMPYWDMLPHPRITNYDVILLNVLISIKFGQAQLQAPEDGRRPKYAGAI